MNQRRINEGLQKNLHNLDEIKKSKLPPTLKNKSKDFSVALIRTMEKADELIQKLS